VDPTLEGLWQKVVAAWDDDVRHRAFVAYCRETGRLEEAARRYRLVSEGTDEAFKPASLEQADDAKKRLDGVATVALAALAADRAEPVEGMHRKIRIAALVVIALMLMLLAYALAPALR
jgi:hypothetical protein